MSSNNMGTVRLALVVSQERSRAGSVGEICSGPKDWTTLIAVLGDYTLSQHVHLREHGWPSDFTPCINVDLARCGPNYSLGT